MADYAMIRQKLLAAGCNNLQRFGYPSCTPGQIISDPLYRRFFESMLFANKGLSPDTDIVIEALLMECKQSEDDSR